MYMHGMMGFLAVTHPREGYGVFGRTRATANVADPYPYMLFNHIRGLAHTLER
jgi:hypothetical protein